MGWGAVVVSSFLPPFLLPLSLSPSRVGGEPRPGAPPREGTVESGLEAGWSWGPGRDGAWPDRRHVDAELGWGCEWGLSGGGRPGELGPLRLSSLGSYLLH